MGHLVEHAILNKLDDELNDAITDVGGDAKRASSLMDYPNIIRTQLSADPNGISGRIIAGPGAEVKETNVGYEISADGTSNAKLVSDIIISENKRINKGESVQNIFTYLFSKVLPNINGNVDIVNEELNKIKDSLKSLDLNIDVIVTDAGGFDTEYNVKLESAATYYIRIIDKYNEKPTYISLKDISTLESRLIKTGEDGSDDYNLRGNKKVFTELKPFTWYLKIISGKNTIPVYVEMTDFSDAIKEEVVKEIGSTEIQPGTVTIEKLDPSIQESINKSNETVKEVETIKTETVKVVEQVGTIEKQVESVEKDNTEIKKQVEVIENNNTEIKKQVEVVEKDNTEIKKQVEAVEQKNDEIKNQVVVVEQKNTEIQNQVNVVKEQIDNVATKEDVEYLMDSIFTK